MEWNVKNAANRDVERQHLNKILKEIRGTISSGGGLTEQRVLELIRANTSSSGGGGGGGSSGGLTSITVSLQGNVTGTATGGSQINIPTVVDPAILGIKDAPIDSNIYWRTGGAWQPVPVN